MAETLWLGVDLGGTDIKAGLVDRTGRARCRVCLTTEAEHGPQRVIDRLAEAIDQAAAKLSISLKDVGGVGIGAPGPMSHSKGMVYRPANLPGWDGVPLRELIQERTGRPTVLENDANAAALGEFWVGAGRDVQNMILLTMGTGIGGAVIEGGRLVRGHFENAGEIGHTIVQPDGLLCNCGQHGCLEQYASATATVRRAVHGIESGLPSVLAERHWAGRQIDAPAIVEAVHAGDALACQVWDETCKYLALACVNLQHLTNPELIVIGGGMSAAGEVLLERVESHRRRMAWKTFDDRPRLALAALGNDAGFVGAGYAARLAFEKT